MPGAYPLPSLFEVPQLGPWIAPKSPQKQPEQVRLRQRYRRRFRSESAGPPPPHALRRDPDEIAQLARGEKPLGHVVDPDA
jgi:hypothetical protein